MKGRESGMPDDSFWESFFNPRCILERMDCIGTYRTIGFVRGGLLTSRTD